MYFSIVYFSNCIFFKYTWLTHLRSFESFFCVGVGFSVDGSGGGFDVDGSGFCVLPNGGMRLSCLAPCLLGPGPA